MLDRIKVLREVHRQLPHVWKNSIQEIQRACSMWQRLVGDSELITKLMQLKGLQSKEAWNQSFGLTNHNHPYVVFSVDGSQIYPDRHRGLACALINIGTAFFEYQEISSAHLHSVPLLVPEEISPNMVDCLRFEKELEVAGDVFRSCQEDKQPVLLIDGVLALWYLEHESPLIRQNALQRFLKKFDDLYSNRSVHAAYVSSPKSTELVKLVSTAAIEYGQEPLADGVCDADFLALQLPVGYRTSFFAQHTGILAEYPVHLRPWFAYINTGYEIARVEIPFWIVQNDGAVQKIVAILWDQILKGFGYPVCIAEAHEQAVVKAADKEFFYELLSSVAQQQGIVITSSQKAYHKRVTGY